jgi:WXG100 family type VII secretion target
MPAARVRGDYDSLGKIAQGFAQGAANTARTNRTLTQAMDQLKRGDWIGKGARAFYKEMDGDIMPSMARLAKALESAARVTQQISKVIKQAEDDSARLFRLEGIGGLVGAALGGALGGLAGGVAGAVGEAIGEMMGGGEGGLGGGFGGDWHSANPHLVRDPHGLFTPDYMDGLIGSQFEGAGSELGDAMNGLLEADTPEEADGYLVVIAELRGRPIEEMRSEYGKFQELAAERDAAGGVGGLSGHPSFMGSNTQMRYGSVVGDAFGIDPVFGAMLNPTGGLVGPGNWAIAGDDTAVGYHGVVHDAAGYLHTYHNAGPGYDYLGREGRDTSSPLSGQREGISYWRDRLGGPSPISAPAEWVMRGVVGGVDIASSAFEGIKGIF